MRQLIEGFGVEVVAVTVSGAEVVAASYRTCRLLFVGGNIGKTDVRRATAGTGR